MIDQFELNKIIVKTEDDLVCLDIIAEKLAFESDDISRFSVLLAKKDRVYNYFVRDRMSEESNTKIYAGKIQSYHGLFKIIRKKSLRVVNDLSTVSKNEITKSLLESGHKSSFSYPLIFKNTVVGIVIFNSSKTGYFNDKVQKKLLYISLLTNGLLIKHYEKKQFLETSLRIALNIGNTRDPETAGHLIRMREYSTKLAFLVSDKKKITHDFLNKIESYASFHDIGKYKIPDYILFSTKKFTQNEREIMNNHCQYGVDIIDDVLRHYPDSLKNEDDYACLKNIIFSHHERYDGKGYPQGLKGELIPLEARIIMVADVFDALLSKRAYKKAWCVSDVVAYMKENSGSMFDPCCIQVLIDNLDDFIQIYEQHKD